MENLLFPYVFLFDFLEGIYWAHWFKEFADLMKHGIIKPMKITLNGDTREFDDSSRLKNVIDQFRKDARHLVAEVNGEIIQSCQWSETLLREGDHIELVNIVGGG